AHVLNVPFVTGRRRQSTQLPVTVDEHLSVAHRHAVDARNESPVLTLRLAQPHGVRFISHPGVAHIDVALPAGQFETGIEAQGDVATAGAIIERLVAHRGVGVARVVKERLVAAGDVVAAVDIVPECEEAISSVVTASGIFHERLGAGGGVVVAGGVMQERLPAGSGIVVAGGVVRERVDSGGGVVVAGGVMQERLGAGGGVVVAGSVIQECLGAAGSIVAAVNVVPERLVAGGSVTKAVAVALERSRANSGVEGARGVVLERGSSVGGVGVAGQRRATERARATPGIIIGIAFVIGRRYLGPARYSAEREDEAGDHYDTAENSVHISSCRAKGCSPRVNASLLPLLHRAPAGSLF